jgi:asparagine synthase (glutamine-hydrolysing)
VVGLSGIVGSAAGNTAVRTVPPTIDDEVTDTYRNDGITVRSAFHTGTTVDQPVEAENGTLVWVWGEVFSLTDPQDGRRSVDPFETPRICAQQYNEYGESFVSRLDGEFLGLLYDPDEATATFFVDRCGARPVYHARAEGGIAFSTNIQTIPDLPGLEPGFEETYLAEYLYSVRVPGTKTPVEEVEQIAPATLLTYDADTGTLDDRQYWEPRYQPVDKPLSYFVRELEKRLARAVADRTPDSEEKHGLLLSGGSDSRAVLATGRSSIDSYHLGDGWNREARAAKRAANTVGSRFEELYRGPDHHETLLERAAPIVEFLGPFNSGHMLGHAETLSQTDALLTGLYSDVLFGSWGVPQLDVDLPSGVTVQLPLPRVPSTPAEYVAGEVEFSLTNDPAYLRAPPFADILSANIHEHDSDGGVEYHGVEYRSVETLALSQFYYPITNGIGFDLFAALQITPTRTPYLDRDLIDLHLEMPLKYRLRHDPIRRALKRLDPALAAVSHASTGVPVGYPKSAHAIGDYATDLLAKFDRSPSYWTEKPVQNRSEVIRANDFLGQALDRNEQRGRALSCLDWPAVQESYRRHRSRETNVSGELYRLVTVLDTPLAKRLLDR